MLDKVMHEVLARRWEAAKVRLPFRLAAPRAAGSSCGADLEARQAVAVARRHRLAGRRSRCAGRRRLPRARGTVM